MTRKYKSNLRQKVLEERSFEIKQESLKEKYDIAPDKEVVVVEKSNTFKFAIKALAGLIRVCAAILLVVFAFIGIVALVYPAPRIALIEIYQMARDQLIMYLGL